MISKQKEIAARLLWFLHQVKATGVTQAQVAERLGLTPEHLSRVCQGHVPVSQRVMDALLREFGLQPAWLLRGEPPMVSMEIRPKEWRTIIPLVTQPSTTTAPGAAEVIKVPTLYQCGHCHREVRPKNEWCPTCGLMLIWPEEEASPEPPKGT